MNYEQFRIKIGRMLGWMVFIGILIIAIGIWARMNPNGLVVLILIYCLICALKYIRFIDQYPVFSNIDRTVGDSFRWWDRLNWKERLEVYKKNKGGVLK